MRKKQNNLTSVAGIVFLVMLMAAPAFSQIKKREFYGTWKMVHDGWEGTLIIEGTKTPLTVTGYYIGGDEKVHVMNGDVTDFKIEMAVDLNDTTHDASDDQKFTGYLFTQSRTAIAGTTKWLNTTFGWYALKESDSTSLPTPPIVSSDTPDPSIAAPVSDHPDPVKGEPEEDPVLEKPSHRLELMTTKPQYSPGEKVVFRLKCTGEKAISLKDSYFIIQYKKDNKFLEFYTSRREPFKKPKIEPGKIKNWSWNQWDNEHQNRTHAGEWRIQLHLLHRSKPMTKIFKIKEN